MDKISAGINQTTVDPLCKYSSLDQMVLAAMLARLIWSFRVGWVTGMWGHLIVNWLAPHVCGLVLTFLYHDNTILIEWSAAG